jgi:UDP-N-acetylmuramate--alanine ligase
MKLDNINRVFLLGIGGIGMSALARYFSLQSKRIYGYDKTSTDLTKKLVEEGFQILYTDLPEKIPEEIINSKTLFIYTPAVPKDNKIFHSLFQKDTSGTNARMYWVNLANHLNVLPLQVPMGKPPFLV